MTAVQSADRLAPRVSADLLRELERRIDVDGGRGSIEVIAPFTGEAIGEIPRAGADDVTAAVARARRAQGDWAELSLKTRIRVLTRFHDLILENVDTALDLVQSEAGKARMPAFEEVFDVAATTRYYCNTAPRLLSRKRRAVSFPVLTKAYEYAHPVGVVGFIVPWNFPFNLGVGDAIPALIAGNGVVIKPDEKTPYSTLFSVKLLDEAGVPPGLVQVVTGEGEVAGPALIDEVDYIMFTGSTQVGRQVAERAGGRLIGSSMELGGKNAAIVLEDADLDVAIPGIIRAVYANGGQLCIAAERIYVQERMADEFARRMVEAINELPISSEFRYAGLTSAMITPAHLEDVQRHVDDAVANGATVLVGGKPRPDVGPTFFEPTLLADVDESMMVCRSETFGPVASLFRFADVEWAIADANDSEFGLSFSVWTGDERRGVEIATRLKAGTVTVNDGYASAWSTYDAPMGGMKSSGLGRRHGSGGLMKFTEAQTVTVQRFAPAFAPPGSMGYERYQAILTKALKLMRRLPFYK